MSKGSALVSFGTNTIFQLLSRVVSAVSALIIVRLLVRYGGVETFGDYQTVIVFTSFFWIITDFGLNALFVRDIKNDESKTQELYSLNLTLRLIIGLLLTLVAIFISLFLNYSEDIALAVLLGALTIVFQSVFGANTVIFQARLVYIYYFFAQIIGTIVNLGLTVLLLLYTNSLPVVIIGYVAGNLILMLVGVFFAKKFVSIRFSKDYKRMWDYFLLTLPVGLSLFFSLGITKIDTLVMSTVALDGVSNSSAVGIYLLAYKIFELATLTAVLSMNTLYPILSEHFGKQNFSTIQSIIKKVLVGMFIFSLFTSLIVFISMDFIYALVAPEAGYETLQEVKAVLTILLVALPIFYLTPIPMFGLILMNKQRYLALIFFTGFIINTILNLTFIPKYTYFAGATITILTEALLLVMLYYFGYRAWRSVTIHR